MTKKEIEDKVLGNCLRYLKENGVYVITLQFSSNSEYYKNLREEINKKFDGSNPRCELPEFSQKDFFEELYSEEYANDIGNNPFNIESVDGSNKLKDTSDRYHNVKDGERLTYGTPCEYDKTIYFFGPCAIIGLFVEDKYTIESLLQSKCNRCRVLNFGCWDSPAGTVQRILSTPIRRNDIIIVNFIDDRIIPNIQNLNLIDSLEKNNVPAKWFVDTLQHCNHKVNQIYTDAIYDYIKPLLDNHEYSEELIDTSKVSVFDSYFMLHFNDFNYTKYDKIGSVVMNCNPFTNGHRYLIEESLKYVDFLIIFVVEENKSSFSFNERFRCVEAGVEDLENVMVVPSGQYILSQMTFPEYFLKIEDEDLIRNVEYDITMFAERIAPRLGITYRFIGEEPDDSVTNEYNKAMKRILPNKGINVIEIPRKKVGSMIISASLVRKHLNDDNAEAARDLIPESTWKVIFGDG